MSRTLAEILGTEGPELDPVDHPTCDRCLGLIDVDGEQAHPELRCIHQKAPCLVTVEEMNERLSSFFAG